MKMKQHLIFLIFGILLNSVQAQSQPQWLADFGSGFVKETDHVNNSSHKTSQSPSSKSLGADATADPNQIGGKNKTDSPNLLANPSELLPPPPPPRREQSPFESVDSRPPPPAPISDQSPVDMIESRLPPVSATDSVRERKLQQLKFILGNDVPRAKLEALLDVFGSDSASSPSQTTRPPPAMRNAPAFPTRERQDRPISNGWPSTPPPPREPRGPFRRQEPRVDPFLSGDSMPPVIPPPPGSANRGQRPSRAFNREFTPPTPSPNFDGPHGRLDVDARRQDMIERRLQQEQAKNSQESNLQMMRTLRALTRQRARTPAAEPPEQPEPGSMNPLLMAALFSGMGGGGAEAGSTGLGGGLGALLAAGGGVGGGGGGGLSSLLGSMGGGGMGGLASMLGLGQSGLGGGLGGLGGLGALGGLGGSSATDATDPDRNVKPTTLPVQAIIHKDVPPNEMTVVKTGLMSQTSPAKTTSAPKPTFTNVVDHHQSNHHAHPVQTQIDPMMLHDVHNQIHDHPVPPNKTVDPDVRNNIIDLGGNELLPRLLDSKMNKDKKENITLLKELSALMPSSVLIDIRRKDLRTTRQNFTGDNAITKPRIQATKEMNVSSSHHSGLLDTIPNSGFGGRLGSHLQTLFGSMLNSFKTTVPPSSHLHAGIDLHGQLHDHPITSELTVQNIHSDHISGHGQQKENGKLAGRDNQGSGNSNSGVPSNLAALLGVRGSGVSNNDVSMAGLPTLSNMMSMTGTGGVASSGAGGFGNTGAVTSSLEIMSLVPGLTADHMSDLVGSYRGPIPREILVQAQAMSRAGQSGDHIADVLGDVMQQWVRQQGLARNIGFSAGSPGLV